MTIEKLTSIDSILYHLRVKARVLGSDVETLTNRVLDNPEFSTGSGGLEGRHHCGHGGLIRHTYEVLSLCMQQQENFSIWGITPWINPKVLFLSAIYHDVGKLWDYTYVPLSFTGPHWESTPHHRLIHHINRSAVEWTRAVCETGLCKDIEDSVLHCILSHHGVPSFGSPVMPKSREAWILHLCDSMSAWMDMADRIDPKKV